MLSGKVIVITGIGPGMGRKLALEAAAYGAKLAIGARSKDFLGTVRDEVKAAGGDVVAVRTDVSIPDDCEALAAAAVDRFGRIDGLVNSAYGPGDFLPFEQADFDAWRKALDVTLFGSLQMSRAVLPHMKAGGGGSIVNISTMETRKPLAGHGSYTIAKTALMGATRQLAVELAPYKIRVNSAVPGWMWGAPVEGYMTHSAKEAGVSVDAMKAEIAARIPLGHIPPDEECAKAVLSLLSDAMSQVTGAALEINGGEYLSL